MDNEWKVVVLSEYNVREALAIIDDALCYGFEFIVMDGKVYVYGWKLWTNVKNAFNT